MGRLGVLTHIVAARMGGGTHGHAAGVGGGTHGDPAHRSSRSAAVSGSVRTPRAGS